MPNAFGNFGFVRKAGDTMTGDLNLGLNALILNDGEHGGCIVGHATSADKIRIRNMANTNEGTFIAGAGYFDGNVSLAAGATVDGVDVSEILNPSGRLYLNTDQTDITDDTLTKVLFDAITSGFADGIEDTDNHKITPAQAGLYYIKGQISYSGVVADKQYEAVIYKNSSVVLARKKIQSSVAPAGGHQLEVTVATLAYLSNTDFVELWARHISGVSTIDIDLGEEYTYLEVQRLRIG